ncbi:FadR/GntR family transcriptional regulator [Sediminicola luteus]|uniref:GntR family transcriptional regulator n=1 Tax=Sediminicola luteus TaxID=319238 RepID=A0A2A4G4Z1_9FLAO|nr:FCD domain-containing protein [Sediminicola luteus]PCE63034.1 GntR family transcriptional regulator [Sediminicola luteus]
MASLDNLKPLSSLTLVDRVELRIKDYIKENRLTVGDAIPKEMEFAEALGVSRTVVREALLRLRAIGMVDSKKHRGMVLTQPDLIANLGKVLDSNMLSKDTLKEIFELRLILEMGMADFLFARITDTDFEALERIVAEEQTQNQDATVFAMELEVAFHGTLYGISKNETLYRFQDMLLPVFRYVHETMLPDLYPYDYSGDAFVSHADLLDLLKKGDPEKFRQGMRRHLEPHFERVLQTFDK